MNRTVLGRTGLEVSVAGLGAGGGAKLGLQDGATNAEAERLVSLALDLGINFFDTAKVYRTEPIIGGALKGVPRDQFVVSTKHHVARRGNAPFTAAQVVAGLDDSLRVMGLDHVDVFQMHGIFPGNYGHAVEVVLPALKREQEKGKFRFLGATESAQGDHGHAALARAVDEDWLDVAMLAFSMVNQNARETLFPKTLEKNIGTLLMFVSRNLFGFPERLAAKLRELADEGSVPAWVADDDEPLEFLIREGGASTLADAAYRYARDEPGADVVLFGTGNPDHLKQNVASLEKPPLPESDRARINELFGALVGVGIEPGMSRGGKTEGG